jgi:hypothetical protein
MNRIIPTARPFQNRGVTAAPHPKRTPREVVPGGSLPRRVVGDGEWHPLHDSGRRTGGRLHWSRRGRTAARACVAIRSQHRHFGVLSATMSHAHLGRTSSGHVGVCCRLRLRRHVWQRADGCEQGRLQRQHPFPRCGVRLRQPDQPRRPARKVRRARCGRGLRPSHGRRSSGRVRREGRRSPSCDPRSSGRLARGIRRREPAPRAMASCSQGALTDRSERRAHRQVPDRPTRSMSGRLWAGSPSRGRCPSLDHVEGLSRSGSPAPRGRGRTRPGRR